MVGLTKDAALDYASSNIRINAICPGIIDTEMMDRFTGDTPKERDRVIAQEPIGRMGRPDEIAATVVWLCSDAASFVTGHAMVADGGRRCRPRCSSCSLSPGDRQRRTVHEKHRTSMRLVRRNEAGGTHLHHGFRPRG